jgi:hypothetical protein
MSKLIIKLRTKIEIPDEVLEQHKKNVQLRQDILELMESIKGSKKYSEMRISEQNRLADIVYDLMTHRNKVVRLIGYAIAKNLGMEERTRKAIDEIGGGIDES